MSKVLLFILSILLLTGCSDPSMVGQSEERYTNSDGSLRNSNVNSFNGRKTAPRKCGDLPF